MVSEISFESQSPFLWDDYEIGTCLNYFGLLFSDLVFAHLNQQNFSKIHFAVSIKNANKFT